MIGYKVLNKVDDKLFSYFTTQFPNGTTSKLAVQYKVNETIEPHFADRPLAVFADLPSAKCFWRNHQFDWFGYKPEFDLVIYEVEYELSEIADYRMVAISECCSMLSYFEEYVDMGQELMHKLPENTVFANKVTLVKEIPFE